MTRRDDPDRAGRREVVVLPCPDPDAAASFFTDRLGFRVDAVFPADDPRVVDVSGHGLRLRLQRETESGPARPPLEIPPLQPSFVLTRVQGGPGWHRGRAGMEYRDLIPDRQGGRFIASHIRIPEGGSVPDYVHFHQIRFQMIFCVKGWVRVVYEDQGPPFVMQAGDCVLQPPRIRHRVLECSPGLEVVEISCPAEHETRVDHDLALPTANVDPGRDFGGQRFVRHLAAEASWESWGPEGFRARDTGIAAATDGLAGAWVVEATGDGASSEPAAHRGEFRFLFLLGGRCRLCRNGSPDEPLAEGDAVVVPAGMPHALAACSADLVFLEIRLPGNQAVADV